MRVSVRVGEIRVDVDGLDYTRRQVNALVRHVASIAVALTETQPEPERPPVGFTAHLERAPDIEPDLSEFFEDEE